MPDLIQDDFKQEGQSQWVAHKQGYRVVVRRYDGGYEIIIRAEVTSDPTTGDWEKALGAVNYFFRQLRIGQKIDMSEDD